MIDTRKPTDQNVRDRIVHELDTSFAIEAGAGTGKTTLLTQRIVEAIRTGHATLSQIVAITFTEKAAGELKVRLRTAFEDERANSEGEPEISERFGAALAALDAAHVSTIHSFCSELLIERPVEAEIDPGFGIADALAGSMLFDQVWDEWLQHQLADPVGPLRAAFAAGMTVLHLQDHARFLRDNPDLAPAGGQADAAALAADIADEFVLRARDLLEHMESHCDSPACTCVSRILAAAAAADQIADAGPHEALARIVALSLGLKRVTKGCANRAVKERCKTELNELHAFIEDRRESWAQALVCHVTDALRGVGEAYRTAKRDRALLDFDDLLRSARDLLRDRKDVRAYFQRRFRMILIDECQDTDPLQTELVFFLAEDGAHADDWREVRLAPGKLLFVGDPKQSIYRFRRADIEIYQAARRLVAAAGGAVTVQQNFRSTPGCIDWVNAVFGELIQRPEDGDYQPDYVALHAWRADVGPGVTILRPPEDVVFGKVGEARAAEAAAVAALIRRMVETCETVVDKVSGEPRPVTWGDVAILFRKRTSFELYERALEVARVPFRSVSGRGFFARQEVTELRVVLAAIERAHDPLAVVAALRTSLMGVSDAELAAMADGGFDYFGSDPPDALAELRRWHEQRNEASIPEMVRRVLSESKARELFYLKPGGEQRAANLDKVIDAARSFEQTPGATFGGFVDWLADMTMIGDEAESSLDEAEAELVKLITIHQSKGLEFPVVVMADVSFEKKPTVHRVVDRAAGVFHVQFGSKGLCLRTRGFEAGKEFKARRDDAERVRLFYVAATRARDRIVLPAFPTRDEPGGYLTYVADLAGDAAAAAGDAATEIRAEPQPATGAAWRAFRVDLAGGPPGDCSASLAERAAWEQQRAALIEAAKAGPQYRTPSSLTEHDPDRDDREGIRRSRAQQIGTAVHAVLEQADLADPELLAGPAERVAAEAGIAEAADEIAELAANALAQPVVQRAAQAAVIYREVPFAVASGGDVTGGVIDLAFDDGDGLHVVDYKTDGLSSAEAADRAREYGPQMAAYAAAAEAVFGRPPASVTLLFLRPGVAVSLSAAE
jgi:ATP-dependent helicase/nuclease subunit A